MTLALAPAFGAGGAEPYARALQSPASRIYLRDAGAARADQRRADQRLMDVATWTADADLVDHDILSRVGGPVLDIGCGPGRLVRAGAARGMTSVGIDVSAAAIETARRLGGTYSEQSVFDRVPAEGVWLTALLLDGNIGIGGDIPTLLRRCAQVIAPEGVIVAELDADPEHERRFEAEVVDETGATSARFPWAEIGLDRLRPLLDAMPLRLADAWSIGGRSFALLAR